LEVYTTPKGIYSFKVHYEVPNTDLKWISRFTHIPDLPKNLRRQTLILAFHEFLVELKVWEECSPSNKNARRICAIDISTSLGKKVHFGKIVDAKSDICSKVIENRGEMVIATFYGSYFPKSGRLSSLGCYSAKKDPEIRHLQMILEENDEPGTKFNEDFIRAARLRALVGFHLVDTEAARWHDDSELNSCYLCSIPFGFYYRRHHCRCCGWLFCYDCASEYRSIPEVLPSVVPRDSELKRVCKRCCRSIDNIARNSEALLLSS
jgi:hypothetical protein